MAAMASAVSAAACLGALRLVRAIPRRTRRTPAVAVGSATPASRWAKPMAALSIRTAATPTDRAHYRRVDRVDSLARLRPPARG